MTLFWDKSKKRFSYEHIVSPNCRNENGLVELELYFQFLIVVGTLRTVAFQSANINSHFVGKRFWLWIVSDGIECSCGCRYRLGSVCSEAVYIIGWCENVKLWKMYFPQMNFGYSHKNKIVLEKETRSCIWKIGSPP